MPDKKNRLKAEKNRNWEMQQLRKKQLHEFVAILDPVESTKTNAFSFHVKFPVQLNKEAFF